MTDAEARARPSIFDLLWHSPMLLLGLTALMWGGNSVAGRLAVGEISPMALVFLRWGVACIPLLIAARANLKEDFKLIWPRWRYIAPASIFGFTAFNALFYVAAHKTSAVNISILQGLIPGLVIIGAWSFYGIRLRLLQTIGVLITMAGVIVIAARGDWATLRTLDFNAGDVMMIVAAVLYAGYILLLRQRPAVSSIGLFAAMAVVAFVTSAPLLAIEVAEGAFFWPTAKGLAVLAYVALFPSLIAQIFFIRGVQLIGPSRAGVFVNLVPIFGALLAVALLGEPFAFYHAAALCLVVAGLWTAERSARAAAPT
ncbi:MAG TPA: DMT family transporter [Roseiarcus sp.]|nr:DMT family transporter [Roseiarcus sp.]